MGIMRRGREHVDVFHHGIGGSEFVLIPVSERVKQAIEDSGFEIKNRDSDSLMVQHFNYPTSTNRVWAQKPYNKVMDAIKGMVLEPLHLGYDDPYPIGSRVVYP